MSENMELMRRDDAHHLIAITPEAEALKNDALAAAGLIGKVRNDAEQERAVAAQMQLKRILNAVERSRKDVKQPVLDFGRDIDAKAKEFRAELDTEFNRVSRAVADYQDLLLQKARAAEAAKRAELTRLEKERENAIARASCHEEVEAVQAEFNERALQESLAMAKTAPTKLEGQIVREEWDVTVTDPYRLAQAYPDCVTITPRLSEIKSKLDMGMSLPGVQARKIVKATVRAS